MENKVLVKIDQTNDIMIQADSSNRPGGFVLYTQDCSYPDGFGIPGNPTTWSIIDTNDLDFQNLPDDQIIWFENELGLV